MSKTLGMVVNEVYKGHKKELALLKSMLQFRVVLLHKLRKRDHILDAVYIRNNVLF